MPSITRTGASWNRDWVAGEHGGESFKTTDAIVDVFNPQHIKVGKVFVGVSRGFADQDAVTTKIAALQKGLIVLVSPTHGATAAVRKAALELGLEMHIYTARFEKYPTAEAAYFARDEEMIRDADRVILFWNGCSPGTGHEVAYARGIGKPIEIFMIDQGTSNSSLADSVWGAHHALNPVSSKGNEVPALGKSKSNPPAARQWI